MIFITYVHLGRYKQAVDLLELVLAHDEERFGYYHPDYLLATINQGMALIDLASYQNAENALDNALNINEHNYPKVRNT